MVGNKLLLGAAALVMAAAPIGASIAGGVGGGAASNAFVLRDGKVLPFNASMSLFAGDRVFTRAGGHARVAAKGCTTTLQPNSVYTVGAACGTAKDFVSQPNGGMQDGTETGGTGGGVSSTTLIIGGLAIAAIAGGIYAATESDGEPDSPG